MRYVMKQKMFCFGNDFVIKDGDGREVFFVDGKALSIGDQLSFRIWRATSWRLSGRSS